MSVIQYVLSLSWNLVVCLNASCVLLMPYSFWSASLVNKWIITGIAFYFTYSAWVYFVSWYFIAQLVLCGVSGFKSFVHIGMFKWYQLEGKGTRELKRTAGNYSSHISSNNKIYWSMNRGSKTLTHCTPWQMSQDNTLCSSMSTTSSVHIPPAYKIHQHRVSPSHTI